MSYDYAEVEQKYWKALGIDTRVEDDGFRDYLVDVKTGDELEGLIFSPRNIHQLALRERINVEFSDWGLTAWHPDSSGGFSELWDKHSYEDATLGAAVVRAVTSKRENLKENT